MRAGSEVLTVEYKINFLAPAKGSLARAAATSSRRLTLSVVRVEVSVIDDGQQQTCGKLQATLIRLSHR